MSLILRRTMVSGALLVSSMAVVACGGSDAAVQEEQQEAAESMSDAVAQMQQAAEKMTNARAVGPLIPATALQERLPESMDGLPRTGSERQETGAMGFKISTATATYANDDRSIEVTLTDVGGTGMMAAMGAAWAMVDLDKANDTGYERTVTIDGNRGYEKEERYDGGQNSELSVIVSQRVLVKLEGRNVKMDVLRDELKSLRVGGLLSTP